MPPPSKWSWQIGNINATAAQTQAAYTAITSNGRTRDFSVIVWNDIIDKIIEQRQYWGDVAWSMAGAPLMEAYMAPGDWMTARIFNSAVLNMPPIHPWGWEATLERKEILKGDRCYGVYFIYLVDGLNHWMDLTPMPFAVYLTLQTSMSHNVLVRRSLHVINNQNLVWNYSATVDTKRPIYTVGSLNFSADIQLNLPLFHTPHIVIPLFYHVSMQNNTSLLPSVNIEIDYPVTLDISANAVHGNAAHVISDLAAELTPNVTVRIPNLERFAIDNAVVLTSSVNVLPLSMNEISAEITGRYHGEARGRVPDSVHIIKALDTALSILARVSTQKMEEMIVPLNIMWTPTARAGSLGMESAVAALDPLLNISTNVSEQLKEQMEADIAMSHNISALFRRRWFIAHEVDLDFALNTSATVVPAKDYQEISISLPAQLSMSADIGFAQNVQRSSAALSMQTAISVDADLSDDIEAASVSFANTSTISATAMCIRRYTEIETEITGSQSGTATVTDLHDIILLPISAHLSCTSAMSAEISDHDNRVYMAGSASFAHSGAATVDLITIEDTYFSGSLDSDSTVSVDVDMWTIAHVITTMPVTSTMSATVEAKRYVLASEIDDDLVSDLDDSLTENIEFR